MRHLFWALGLRRRRLVIAAVLVWLFLPTAHLFESPESPVLLDRQGKLLGARVAKDGQWRFPARAEVPERFAVALIEAEDHRFYGHPGVDLISVGRAVRDNLRAGRIVSGASTLTMQVIRLSRHDPPRTLANKLLEIVWATRLELATTKDEILALYASNAPFGGNVVGLDAAAWRFFGRSSQDLSWAEAATLAVLPNAPGLIHPGRNRDDLRAKRDRLLDKLAHKGQLQAEALRLAKLEPLPDEPLDLPDLAPHALDTLKSAQPAYPVKSTLDRELQRLVSMRLDRHADRYLRPQGVHNAAAIVADVASGAILAYVGNLRGAPEHSPAVDILQRRRSPGSTLKPLLVAAALDAGAITPNMLLPDVPTSIAGYAPENYERQYDGAVHVSRALSRSLNVPMVRLLQDYGVPRFLDDLHRLGMTSLDRGAETYGLSLILGGGEVTPWELTAVYLRLAQQLAGHEMFGPTLRTDGATAAHERAETVFGSGALWSTFQAMHHVDRPGADDAWRRYASGQPIAWKTGTSYGHRDAWAIAVTPVWVVLVWAGNADGEGRPNLVGTRAAAPVLFEILNHMPHAASFAEPRHDLTELDICPESGFRAARHCPTERRQVPAATVRAPRCPHHQLIHLTAEGTRADQSCASEQLTPTAWFALPPDQAAFYKLRSASYRPLPGWDPACESFSPSSDTMRFVYPSQAVALRIPVELDGRSGRAVFKLAHERDHAKVFWHLNGQFVTETSAVHELSLNPEVGSHRLLVIDDQGHRLERRFDVVQSATRVDATP